MSEHTARTAHRRKRTISASADCGLDTIGAGEWYMVEDTIWEQAWGHISRGTPGEQILCIGFMASDFTDVPANEPDDSRMSYRLLCRVTR